MRTTDLKAAIYAVVIALAVGSGLVPAVLHAGQAGHRGAAVTVVAHSHSLAAGGGPSNNPWD